MKRNGLVTLYLLFVQDTVYSERLTISGITGTSRKELMDYQMHLEDLIISGQEGNIANT